MEVKLNRIERMLMKLGDLLFMANIKVKEIVYKKYDNDLKYQSRSYYPRTGILVFTRNMEKCKEEGS